MEAQLWDLQDADCLAAAERPDDWSELSHERATYEHALQDLGAWTET